MKVLRLLGLTIAKMYYERACAHDPLHPDLPKIIMNRQGIRDRMKALFE